MSDAPNKYKFLKSSSKKLRVGSADYSIQDYNIDSFSRMSNSRQQITAPLTSPKSAHSKKSRPISSTTRQNSGHRTNSQDGGVSSSNSASAAAAAVVSDTETCCICLENLTSASSEALPCSHTFHKHCLLEVRKRASKCPMCNAYFAAPRGTQPNGRMSVSIDPRPLPGHETDSSGTLVITYSFHDGIQKAEHPSPGQAYHGTQRTAYLPNNAEGQKVLRLLRKAWDARVIFTVGTSVTTGMPDSVIWNGIHHKTSIHGGSTHFGYPDKTYLSRVQEEIAAFGITEDSQPGQ